MNLMIQHILDFMMDIERNGEMMYRDMMEKTSNPDLCKLFSILAEQEQSHFQTYETLKQKLSEEEVQLKKEHREYLELMMEDTLLVLYSGRAIDNLEEGIKHALRLEKETILLLYELKSIVSSECYDMLDKMIDEERQHFKWIMENTKN